MWAIFQSTCVTFLNKKFAGLKEQLKVSCLNWIENNSLWKVKFQIKIARDALDFSVSQQTIFGLKLFFFFFEKQNKFGGWKAKNLAISKYITNSNIQIKNKFIIFVFLKRHFDQRFDFEIVTIKNVKFKNWIAWKNYIKEIIT